MYRTTIVAGTLAVCAVFANAQEITYANLNAEFQLFQADDFSDQEVIRLSTQAELTYGDLVASFSANDFDVGGGFVEFGFYEIRAGLGYLVTPEVMVGAGLSFAGSNMNDDASGYEVFAQYQTDQFGGGIRYVAPNSDFSDFYFTQLYAEAEVTAEVTVTGIYEALGDSGDGDFYVAGAYDGGQYVARLFYATQTENDFGFLGLRGAYDLTDRISVKAGVQSFVGDGPDVLVTTIGSGYEVLDGVSVDASYGVLTGESVISDATVISFGLTYEMGEQKRLDQRLFMDALEDLRVGGLVVNTGTTYGLVSGAF